MQLYEKQRRMYFIILAVVVIILAVAQVVLERMFKESADEVVDAHTRIAELRSTAESKQELLVRYKDFEAAVTEQMGAATVFPANAMEMFTAVDAVMKEYHIEHTNSSSSSGTAAGGIMQLHISYSGEYYDLLKALADLRSGEYAMRISDFRINADEQGKVSGTMTVLSIVGGAE